jgi:hypothetical protein
MPRNARRSARTSVQKRRFSPLQREVSIIGQGTWYIEEGDPASAIAALRRGIDLGMNHIDTAEMYGAGAAEELVGDAIAGRRDEVFLVSKVLPQNAFRLGRRSLVRDRSPTSRPTGWIATCCTGPDRIRWRTRLRDSTRSVRRAKYSSLWREQLRRVGSVKRHGRLPANRALSAIRCSIICRNARSMWRGLGGYLWFRNSARLSCVSSRPAGVNARN